MHHALSRSWRGKPSLKVYFVLFVFNLPKSATANLFAKGCKLLGDYPLPHSDTLEAFQSSLLKTLLEHRLCMLCFMH